MGGTGGSTVLLMQSTGRGIQAWLDPYFDGGRPYANSSGS